MADAIDEAKEVLERRLGELEAAADRVRQAIARLGQEGETGVSRAPAPGTSKKAGSNRTRRRRPGPAKQSATPKAQAAKRARPGEREAQLLASMKKSPSKSVAEHAASIGISAQQAYPLLKRLQSAGKVAKSKDGYRAK